MSFANPRYLAFAVLSSVLSSVATLFKVQGVQSVPPLLAASFGILLVSVFSWAWLYFRKQLPTFEKIRSVWKPLLGLTLCRPIIANVLFTIGLSMSLGVKAVFLTKMEPYLVIFWIWVLDGQRPSSNHLLLLFVHIFGAILLSIGGGLFSLEVLWGDLIIFAAVVMAALSYRFAPKVTATLSSMQTATLSETLGGLVTLPFALALCTFEFGPEQQKEWGFIMIHAVLFYALAIPLLYASLRGLDAWHSSALRATGPLVALPVAWYFFGERLTDLQIVGAILVLVTSVLISRKRRV